MTTELLCTATCYMPVGTTKITVREGRKNVKVDKEIVDRFEDDEVHEIADSRVAAYLASGNFVKA